MSRPSSEYESHRGYTSTDESTAIQCNECFGTTTTPHQTYQYDSSSSSSPIEYTTQPAIASELIFYRPPSPISPTPPPASLRPPTPTQPSPPPPIVITHQPRPQLVIPLPQSLECRYLGRSACQALWGMQSIRGPIDQMVDNVKHLGSANELQRVRLAVNERGVLIEASQNTHLKSSAKK